jgi:hypothetical protein
VAGAAGVELGHHGKDRQRDDRRGAVPGEQQTAAACSAHLECDVDGQRHSEAGQHQPSAQARAPLLEHTGVKEPGSHQEQGDRQREDEQGLEPEQQDVVKAEEHQIPPRAVGIRIGVQRRGSGAAGQREQRDGDQGQQRDVHRGRPGDHAPLRPR